MVCLWNLFQNEGQDFSVMSAVVCAWYVSGIYSKCVVWQSLLWASSDMAQTLRGDSTATSLIIAVSDRGPRNVVLVEATEISLHPTTLSQHSSGTFALISDVIATAQQWVPRWHMLANDLDKVRWEGHHIGRVGNGRH